MALTPERAESAVRMLRTLRSDIEADMHKLEGQPLDGRVVAVALGEQAAQIDALARVLIEHLTPDAKDDCPSYAEMTGGVCEDCTEVDHPQHRRRTDCIAPDLSATVVDQAKADHLNAAMAAIDHPYTHLTAEEAADCPTCSPSGLPRRIEGGDGHD